MTSVAEHRLLLIVVTSVAEHRRLLIVVTSSVVEHRLYLGPPGSVVVVPGLSCPAACGMFLDQESKVSPL